MLTEYSPPRAKRGRKAAALVLGAILLAGTASSSFTVLPASPAVAIDAYHGAGVNWGPGVHANGAGNFVLPDGRFVYCAEMFIFTDPSSSIPDYITTGTIPAKSDGGIEVYATSGNDLKKIGFVMSKYGQTNNDVQAAATALAIWSMRAGNAGYTNQLNTIRASVGTDVVNLAQSYMNEAAAWVAAGAGDGGIWDPSVINETGPYAGTIKLPPGTKSMTITNGTWSDGTTTKTWGANGAPAGTELSWRGTPPSDNVWDKYYRVSFTGTQLVFDGSVQFGDGGGWQSSVTAGPPTERPLETIYLDPDTSWAPTVSSLVTTKFISKGETLTDTITFGTLPAATGRSDQWRWRLGEDGQTREWMPVKATGTIYGPFLSDPALNPSPEAPAGAPVAGTIDFTTINEDGSFLTDDPKGKTWNIDSGVKALEQGYYTFKWDIVGDDQHESVVGTDNCVTPDREAGCRVFPTNYFFSDGFGTAGETQTAKMPAVFSTELSTNEVALGGTFTDSITIPAMQNWLRDNTGARHTMTLTGTAYLVTGTPGSELVQSSTVPEDAIAFGTYTASTDPSKNAQVVESDPITIPVGTPAEVQYVTMRWCVENDDQIAAETQGVWEESCDDFGVPAESAKIVRPEVTTQAKQLATIHDPIKDTAIVNGPVPASSEVRFNVFKKVVAGDAKRDADGNKTDVLWTEAEIAELGDKAVCVAENKITTTTGIPVTEGVNKNTEYDSPDVVVDAEGVYWWIEQLVHRNPETGEETVIEEGECGLPNETTTVEKPKVTTKATAEVYVGDDARDTAIVTGPIPGKDSGVKTVVTFEAFEKTGNTAVCTADNRVFNLTEPVTVTGAGEYKSKTVKFKKAGTYYWVETLTYVHEDGEKEIVHVGKCGLPDETTKVIERPALALTGLDGEPTGLSWGVGIAGGLLLAAGATFYMARRRRFALSAEEVTETTE